jgi:hypothetical protein
MYLRVICGCHCGVEPNIDLSEFMLRSHRACKRIWGLYQWCGFYTIRLYKWKIDGVSKQITVYSGYSDHELQGCDAVYFGILTIVWKESPSSSLTVVGDSRFLRNVRKYLPVYMLSRKNIKLQIRPIVQSSDMCPTDWDAVLFHPIIHSWKQEHNVKGKGNPGLN